MKFFTNSNFVIFRIPNMVLAVNGLNKADVDLKNSRLLQSCLYSKNHVFAYPADKRYIRPKMIAIQVARN